jgi:hypothetical protein
MRRLREIHEENMEYINFEEEQYDIEKLKGVISMDIIKEVFMQGKPTHIAVYSLLEIAAELTNDVSYFENACAEVVIHTFCSDQEKDDMLTETKLNDLVWFCNNSKYPNE